MLRRVVMGRLANETKPANGVLFDWVHQVDADQQYRSRDLAHLGGLRVILLLMFRHRANVAAFESVGLVDPVAVNLAQLFPVPLVRADGCLS